MLVVGSLYVMEPNFDPLTKSSDTSLDIMLCNHSVGDTASDGKKKD